MLIAALHAYAVYIKTVGEFMFVKGNYTNAVCSSSERAKE